MTNFDATIQHVSQTWISNCIRMNTAQSNYLSLPEIPVSGTKIHEFGARSRYLRHGLFEHLLELWARNMFSFYIIVPVYL